ncbi:hypothetical protein H6501_05410 [Candidatus Woesearchaeota archaeon]|nr:hypothetical protein [Candidatus Woesearchaeota archaeon]USN44123.1 MAG: hypothetical protein H6500_07085 [Candidatus Woesearchaeota archaeon]
MENNPFPQNELQTIKQEVAYGNQQNKEQKNQDALQLQAKLTQQELQMQNQEETASKEETEEKKRKLEKIKSYIKITVIIIGSIIILIMLWVMWTWVEELKNFSL